jgi:hypothetical protein
MRPSPGSSRSITSPRLTMSYVASDDFLIESMPLPVEAALVGEEEEVDADMIKASILRSFAELKTSCAARHRLLRPAMHCCDAQEPVNARAVA